MEKNYYLFIEFSLLFYCLLSSIFISFSASLCFLLLCLIFCQRKSSQIGCYLFYYFYFMRNFIFLYRLAHLLVCHREISSFRTNEKKKIIAYRLFFCVQDTQKISCCWSFQLLLTKCSTFTSIGSNDANNGRRSEHALERDWELKTFLFTC